MKHEKCIKCGRNSVVTAVRESSIRSGPAYRHYQKQCHVCGPVTFWWRFSEELDEMYQDTLAAHNIPSCFSHRPYHKVCEFALVALALLAFVGFVGLALGGCASTQHNPLRHERGNAPALRMAGVPAVITVERTLPPSTRADAYRAARYWNCELGTTVFVPPVLGYRPRAQAHLGTDWTGTGVEPNRGGLFIPLTMTGRRLYRALIVVDWAVLRDSPQSLRCIWRHELGHMLGLDHTVGSPLMKPIHTINEPGDCRATTGEITWLRNHYNIPNPSHLPPHCGAILGGL